MEMEAKIEPLRIVRGAYGADLDIRSYGNGFAVRLDGHGFEASRILSPDDLRDIRDWINRALAEG
jgi:hypothetical protein